MNRKRHELASCPFLFLSERMRQMLRDVGLLSYLAWFALFPIFFVLIWMTYRKKK